MAKHEVGKTDQQVSRNVLTFAGLMIAEKFIFFFSQNIFTRVQLMDAS